MNLIFQDLLYKCVTVYLDDILVFSKDVDKHLQCKGCTTALPHTVGITQQRSRHGTIVYYKYQCPLPILVLGFGYAYPFRLYMQHLRLVFERLHKEKFMAKQQKCELGKTCIKYLGHVIENGTVYADPNKVNAVRTWPKPENIKEVQQFMGLANYYA